jgi:hypothetical protein
VPSEHTSGTTTADRPTFPDLEADIGEDPARFLCADLSVVPLIRGMADEARAAAWLAVARQLDHDAADALAAKVAALRGGDE